MLQAYHYFVLGHRIEFSFPCTRRKGYCVRDESLDYTDQEPLPTPTSTGVLGPISQLLSDIPDLMDYIKELKSLYRALDALPILHQGHH